MYKKWLKVFNTTINMDILNPKIVDPDITIVSCYIDLNLIETRTKTPNVYSNNIEAFLSLKYNMVLFLDNTFLDTVKNFRSTLGLLDYTHIIPIEYSDLPKYKYRQRILENYKTNPPHNKGIARYHPMKDTPNYMVLNCSKYNLIERAIDLNHFSTNFFAWIDMGITGAVGDMIGVDEALSIKSEKITVPYIIPKIVHKNHDLFFRGLWFYVCGGYSYGNIKAWNAFNREFDSLFEKILEEGYYGNEENFLGYLLVENPSLFTPYYSDYYNIFKNRPYTKADVNIGIRSMVETQSSGLKFFSTLTATSLKNGLDNNSFSLPPNTSAFIDNILSNPPSA